jgi:predicted nuclease with RNAse H fold
MSVRILGVDLASQPSNTSVAVLDGLDLVHLASTADDDTIVELARTCVAVGIDAPLGWPDDFVDVITAHHRGEPIPPAEPRSLQLRRTDLVVHESTGKRPLSVSTDRIGVVALRAIRLLERIAGAGAARDGTAGVYETYPGGAVAHWGLVERSYKRRDSTPERGAIVEALGRHLELGEHRDRMIAGDDDLDAVLCAALAGLAHQGRTTVPGPADADHARREGWIHVPTGSIADLRHLR